MSMYDDRTTTTYRGDENRNNTARWVAIVVLVLLALAALYFLTRPAADPNAVNDPNNALTGQDQTGAGGDITMPTPMDADTGAVTGDDAAAGDAGAVTDGETAGDPALATPLGAEGGAADTGGDAGAGG